MQDFASKRNALFASLDDASKELKGTPLDQSGMDTSTIKMLKDSATTNETNGVATQGPIVPIFKDKTLSRMRGKESIFKKPELPISRCLKPRKTPDYQINPHKWKKYSLEDVDISDQTNNSAAFAFLKKIDEQHETQPMLEDSEDASKLLKIEFKKSSTIKRHLKALSRGEVADAEVDKPKLKGSKLVMPEYVIGLSLDRKKKQIVSNVQRENKTAAKLLNLAHLQEYEDEVVDD